MYWYCTCIIIMAKNFLASLARLAWLNRSIVLRLYWLNESMIIPVHHVIFYLFNQQNMIAIYSTCNTCNPSSIFNPRLRNEPNPIIDNRWSNEWVKFSVNGNKAYVNIIIRVEKRTPLCVWNFNNEIRTSYLRYCSVRRYCLLRTQGTIRRYRYIVCYVRRVLYGTVGY